MAKEIFQVRWVITYKKPHFRQETITTEKMTKFKAMRRYFDMMNYDVSNLTILRDGQDVTGDINKWLNSSCIK